MACAGNPFVPQLVGLEDCAKLILEALLRPAGTIVELGPPTVGLDFVPFSFWRKSYETKFN